MSLKHIKPNKIGEMQEQKQRGGATRRGQIQLKLTKLNKKLTRTQMKKLDSEMHLYDRDEQAFEKQAYWNKHMFSSEFDKIYFGWTALQS